MSAPGWVACFDWDNSPPSKDSLACGCSRAEAAASNHCSKDLPKPALNEVPGALGTVKLLSFILQGGYGWAVTSHEDSDRSSMLERSLASLGRPLVGEDPAPGGAGMQECGCPHPAQPEPVSCSRLTCAPCQGAAGTCGVRPGLQAGALIPARSHSACARELSLRGFWSRPHFGGWLIKMLSPGSWLVLSSCPLCLFCRIQRAEAPQVGEKGALGRHDRNPHQQWEKGAFCWKPLRSFPFGTLLAVSTPGC